ncbi:MAG: hypothetical protein M0R02_02595 [Bacteroidales bacterium]|nr:hypothetical protein [Bacteroidales bacterium]NLK82240.1 hypothetical protein [Bacteroidales bacterium]
MNVKHTFFRILFLGMFVSSQTYAQKQAQAENFADSLYSGLRDINKELYESAIRKFQSVPVYDTMYAHAQHELGLAYIRSGEFNKACAVFDSLRYAETDFGNNIYTAWAIALDSLNKKEEALAILDTGISHYPHQYLLYYSKAVYLQAMEQYEQAMKEFQNAIMYAPGHVNSHIQLGLIAAQEGQYTRAMLSLMYAALMSSNPQLTLEIFYYMDLVADLNIEVTKHNVSFGDDALFTDIDLIFERQIALNKKVHDASKLNLSSTKQFQMICEALATHDIYTKDNQDFWLQMYVPMFTNIFKAQAYAGMIYFCLQDVQVSSVQKRVKKGKKDIDWFIRWLQHRYSDYRNHRYMMYDGEWQKMSFYFHDNGTVGGIGKVDENKDVDGVWNYFHTNGRVQASGIFENGKRTDLWQWFLKDKNVLSETIMFKEDKKEGAHITYKNDGSVYSIAACENDEYNGFITYFYPSGDTMSHIMIKDGERDSLFLSYHENGALKTKAFFKAGDLHGTLTTFYENDSIRYSEEYSDNMLNGNSVTYYYNGAVHQKAYYKNDELQGAYEQYYANGNVLKTGNYKNNTAVGSWTTYYANGVKKEEIEYDEKGKINATRTVFDIDGVMYLKEEYKNGELLRITYFDKQGTVFFESKKSGKSIQYKSFLPDKTLQLEGNLVSDEKHGVWNYYNKYGVLESTDTFEHGKKVKVDITYSSFGKEQSVTEYKDNELHGLSLEYHPNTIVKQEGYYTDGNTTGTWYRYYIHGEMLDKLYFIDDDVVYHCKYGVTGKITDEYFYKDNVLQSQKKYDSTGVVQQEISQFHGEILHYDPHSKKLTSKLFYKNGKAQGNAEWYYYNGKIATRGAYCNGERHGVWEWYSVKGTLLTKITYMYGEVQGVLYRYYESNGALRATETYEFDKQQGEETYYHANGKMHYTCNYIDDNIHGEVRYFSEAGNVYQIRYYNQGKVIGHSYLDKDGNAVPMIPFNGSGKVVFYYSNGTKSLEWERENGRLTGEYIRYAENGTVMERETYENHKNHGKSMRMTSPQHLGQELNYYYGELHGVNKKYYPNGVLFLESTYYYGEIHGTEKEYNTKGQLTYIREYYSGELIHEKIVRN